MATSIIMGDQHQERNDITGGDLLKERLLVSHKAHQSWTNDNNLNKAYSLTHIGHWSFFNGN
jgi:hypothetical protein